MSSESSPVGLTADAGFQIGMSRTVDHALDAVFELLRSAASGPEAACA